MLQDLSRLILVIVLIIFAHGGVDTRGVRHKHGATRNSTTKITNSHENSRTTNDKFNYGKTYRKTSHMPRKRFAKLKTRKHRAIQFASLAGLDRAALGLNPLTVPYGARLAPIGYQQTPALQQLAQYRGLVPTAGGLIPNAASLRLPYGLQYARLLPALSLYRNLNRVQLPGNGGGGMATDVHVYKGPNRLKYNSIPLKPGLEQQELVGNALNLPALLQLNSARDDGPAEDPDETEADLEELGGVCSPSPCHNGGSCVNLGETFECVCRKGFTGKTCLERNPCLPNPCHNDGQCTVSGSSFDCSCSLGWKGERCEEPNKCHPNPCMNGGSCTELEFDYECTCPHGFHGKSCQEKRASCFPNPCLNEGQCEESSSGNFECICKSGYSGAICAVTQNKCLQNPCQNGGSCSETMSSTGYECRCPSGYKGITCEERSPCQSNTCQNGGTCFETESGFKCLCRIGFSGNTCEARHSCQPNVCKNGAKCIEHENGFKCICPSGYKGSYCDETDHCRPNPCQHGGECVETENGFKCHCQAQYKGLHCEDLNMCFPNPCKNGGQCLGYEGGYKCMCLAGYKGDNCDDKNPCDPNPCHNGGACIQQGNNFKCSCKRGYTGEKCKMVDSCLSNPCQHGGTCKAEEGGFTCTCMANYRGTFCNEREPCHPNPCHNGGKCLSTSEGFVCRCSIGYRGETCTEEDECQPNPCQNGGRCLAHYFGGGFDCECPMGFRGTSCQEKDPCRPDPCGHGGFCTEIGGGFACNCSLGFQGPTCMEIDQCHPSPCQHGGYCREVVGGTGFSCRCISGYKGARCEEKDRCHPNPCMHDGMCMEINDELGFLCNCTTGYRGSHCQDTDPCHPNPCFNSGACLHTDDGFVCNCSIGFKGGHCQDRDLCKPNPCQFGNKCHQTGAGSYQCVKNLCSPSPCLHGGRCIEVNDEDYLCACPQGFTGKNCDERDMCQPNPCMNGGTCSRTDFGGYKCDCTSGYGGANCTVLVTQVNAAGRHNVPAFHSTTPQVSLDKTSPTHPTTELAKEVKSGKPKEGVPYTGLCEPNPCQNSGSCNLKEDSFECDCRKGFAGRHCELKNPCIPSPCNHGGTCLLGEEGNFACRCAPRFAGATCEETTKVQRLRLKPHVDYCTPNPCKNRGVCVVEEGKGYSCACQGGFTGFHCQVDHCAPNPCKNKGLCLRDKINQYKCNCQNGFLGHNCEINSCLPNPCKNDGLCVTVHGKGYQCKCRDGFNGPHCESNPCVPNPCHNGGSCLVFYTVYLCKCTRAYRGTRCNVLIPEQALAPAPPPVPSHAFVSEDAPVRKTTEHMKATACTSNPCSNSGVCLETIDGGFECFCRGDFSGPRCEDVGAYTYSSAPKFFPGRGEECQHCDLNAHCVGGHCICKSGFVGDGLDCWVETQRDKEWTCKVNPCRNGGTCKPGISKCVCRLGYVGDYCESYCPPSVHLSFDKYSQSTLLDDSGSENNGVLANGAQIAPHGGKCGNSANLLGGDVLLDGSHFTKIPREGITISTWVKLDTNKGIQSIFDTVGSHSSHQDGQYHFEIENGKVRWFHRNENHNTIFSLLTRPVIREGIWTQITATYSARKQRARVYVNGDLRQEEKGHGLLSLDWGGKVGIGRHKHPFGNRLLRGMVDEFYIFPGELPRLEVLVLMRHCHVYFTKPKKVTEESSKTRDFNSVTTLPANGHRTNQPHLVHPPLIIQTVHPPAPAYQRQPASSTDYVASNLQQILASLTGEETHQPRLHPSLLYKPPQGYVAPTYPVRLQPSYRPAPIMAMHPRPAATQQAPQIWSANMWSNHRPDLVGSLPVQGSVRHNTPPRMQQMGYMGQQRAPPIAQNQAGKLLGQLQQPQTGHITPPGMQQMSAMGQQRAPLTQNQASKLPGQLQQPQTGPVKQYVRPMSSMGQQRAPMTYNQPGKGPGQLQQPQRGPIKQYTNPRAQTIQLQVAMSRPNKAAVVRQMAYTGKGLLQRFQKPYATFAQAGYTGQKSLGQSQHMSSLQANNQRPYTAFPQPTSMRQKPLIQNQRITALPPVQKPNRLFARPAVSRAQVSPMLQQQSLAYKMALLERAQKVPQTNFGAPMASTQPKKASYQPNYKPTYFAKAQQQPPRGTTAPFAQRQPQRQAQTQVSPFNPNFINKQRAWPWSVWGSQASPLVQAPHPPAPLNPLTAPSYARNALGNHPTAPQYPVSPQVLLYYYLNPKAVNRPSVGLTNVPQKTMKVGKSGGTLPQRLTQQLPYASFHNKQAVVVTTPKPASTAQGKSTLTQHGQLQYRIVPAGAYKQFVHLPYGSPYYPLVVNSAGSSYAPLSRATIAAKTSKQFQGTQKAQASVQKPHLKILKGQMASLPATKPPVPQVSMWNAPYVQYPNVKPVNQPQNAMYNRLSTQDKQKLTMTNGLINRPIYIETVPYQLYYQLQQVPSFNTNSNTQRYLSRALSDILKLRMGKHKKKKKKKKKKRGTKAKT